jgi:glyoxylase I family protein
LGIDHVNLVVRDLARSIAFYERYLGMRRGFEATLEGEWVEALTGLPGAKALCVFMECPGQTVRLELLQYLTPSSPGAPGDEGPHTLGLGHLAFVVDDVDALVERLRAEGVTIHGGPATVPFVVGRFGRKRLAYVRDPDGAIIELASYIPADAADL